MHSLFYLLALAALLPNPAPPRFYFSNLYEYIDGGAEAYHRYGMVALVHQEYRAGDTDVTVDIYDMGNPLRAFGIYSAERSPRYHFVPVGAEGYSSEGMLNFVQGAYYVKLLGFSNSGESAAILDGAAQAISAKIGGSRSLPRPVPWLPLNGLVKHSERYILKAPLGFEFLSPAVTAVYRINGNDTTLLVSLAPDPASVMMCLKKALRATPVAGLPAKAWRATRLPEAALIFFACGRYTILIMDPPAQPDSLVKEILESAR